MIRQTRAELKPLRRLGDVAYTAIQCSFHGAVLRASGVLADRDPEEIHQMRVNLRRLRTALELFGMVLDLPEAVSDRRISTIAKKLGRVRDVDVMGEWLARYQRQRKLSSAEKKVVAKVQRQLNKRRKRAMAGVKKLFKGKVYRRFVKQMQAWLRSPRYRDGCNWPMAAVLPDLLLPSVSRLLLHPAWRVATQEIEGQMLPKMDLSSKALAKVLQHQEQELHHLRKQSKRLRYQVELLRGDFGADLGDRFQDFKRIQKVLGEFQDEAVLTQMLQRTLGQRWAKKLPRLARYFRKQNKARWKRWQVIQGQYLDPTFRTELRQQVINLGSSKVCESVHFTC